MKSNRNMKKSSSKRLLCGCKKPSWIPKSPRSESRIVVNIEELTTVTDSFPTYEQKGCVCSNLDTSDREITTNEPLDTRVEDDLQSLTISSPLDGSKSSEKLEIASNYASNLETIFSPILDGEFDTLTDLGNFVQWEMPNWETDGSGNELSYSDFCFPDVIMTNLTFNENGVNDVFTDVSPLPNYIFPDPNPSLQLPYLEEDGSAEMNEVKSDEDNEINADNRDLFMTNAETDQAEEFDPQLFIQNQQDLSDVLSNYRPDLLLMGDIKRRKAVTLVLDLDETLIHSDLKPCKDADFTFKAFYNNKENTIYVKQRPYLFWFLQKVEELFNVVIFTASSSVYASQILDRLDPYGKIISQRFYRDSCIHLDGIYTKDLTILGLDLAKVALVDNSPKVYRLQINNGIPIKSWYNDPNDNGLTNLLPFLETLADVDDVRPIIFRQFGNKD